MRSRLFGTRRRKLATIASLIVLALGGTAAAAWLITGTGFGGGVVAVSAGSLTVSDATSLAAGDAVAPNHDGNLKVRVQNTGQYDVTLQSFKVPTTGGTITFEAGTAAECATEVVLNQKGVERPFATPLPVVPQGQTVEVVLPAAIHGNDNLSFSACAGKMFKVAGITVTGS